MLENNQGQPQPKGLSCFYETLWSKQEQTLHFSPLLDGDNLHTVGYVDVKLVHIASLPICQHVTLQLSLLLDKADLFVPRT